MAYRTSNVLIDGGGGSSAALYPEQQRLDDAPAGQLPASVCTYAALPALDRRYHCGGLDEELLDCSVLLPPPHHLLAYSRHDGPAHAATADAAYFALYDAKSCDDGHGSTAQVPLGRPRGGRRKGRTEESQHRQRTAANERERRRMSSINLGFERLRARVPAAPYEKKLSKVDTLRMAIDYIHGLKQLLAAADAGCNNAQQSARGGVIRPQQSGILLPPPPKKIVIECPAPPEASADPNVPSVQALSLSWSKTTDKYGTAQRTASGMTLASCAKVWMPTVTAVSDVVEAGARNAHDAEKHLPSMCDVREEGIWTRNDQNHVYATPST